MTTLVINASIRGDDSVSRTLSLKFAEQRKAAGETIIERDLTQDMHFVSAESFAAVATPKEDRTDAQQAAAELADTLIEELQTADTIVFGAPVYNFGPPASLKAWADLVARAGTTFRYTENGPQGLLEGKKAYIMAVSGGTPIGADFDFMSPWLTFFLGFLGITDVEIVAADGIMGADGEAKINAAHEKVKGLAA